MHPAHQWSSCNYPCSVVRYSTASAASISAVPRYRAGHNTQSSELTWLPANALALLTVLQRGWRTEVINSAAQQQLCSSNACSERGPFTVLSSPVCFCVQCSCLHSWLLPLVLTVESLNPCESFCRDIYVCLGEQLKLLLASSGASCIGMHRIR
jgi:hypothetical protein